MLLPLMCPCSQEKLARILLCKGIQSSCNSYEIRLNCAKNLLVFRLFFEIIEAAIVCIRFGDKQDVGTELEPQTGTVGNVFQECKLESEPSEPFLGTESATGTVHFC